MQSTKMVQRYIRFSKGVLPWNGDYEIEMKSDYHCGFLDQMWSSKGVETANVFCFVDAHKASVSEILGTDKSVRSPSEDQYHR